VAERLRSLEERRAAREKEKRGREEAEASRLAIERLHRRRKVATVVASCSLVVLAVVTVLAYQAIQARKEADQRRRQADELVDFMLGDLHGSLESMGRLDVLGKVAAKSQEYLAAQPDEPGSTEAARRRGISHLATADVMLDQGETQRAIEGYRAAQAIFVDLVEHEPTRRQWRLDLASVHSKLGDALTQGGERVAAVESFRAALGIGAGLLTNDPSDPEAKLILARAHSQIGAYQAYSGRLAEAFESLGKALELTSAQQPPARAPWRYWEIVLTSQRLLGNIHSQKLETDEAMRAYQTALAIAERLSVEDPANLNWRIELADCQARLGNIQALEGKNDVAIAAYRSAVATYRTLRGVDASNRKWGTKLAQTLTTLVELQIRGGELDAALASYEQARVAVRELAAQDPANEVPRMLLRALERNVGQVRWRRGEKRLALEAYLSERSQLEPSFERNPSDRNLALAMARNHIFVGHCFLELGEASKARHEWRSALELSGRLPAESPYTQMYRAWALLGLGRIEEARSIVERIPPSIDPDPRLRDLIRKAGLKLHPKGAQARTELTSRKGG
jgi:serine/threonine-protein kinase